jgi:hypothetical protein
MYIDDPIRSLSLSLLLLRGWATDVLFFHSSHTRGKGEEELLKRRAVESMCCSV